MNQQYPLQQFVHQILLRRVALVALALTLVVGGVAWFQVRNLTTERTVSLARERLTLVRTLYAHNKKSGLGDQEAVNRALESLGAIQHDNSSGQFVYAVFYNRAGDFGLLQRTPAAHWAEEIVGQDRVHHPLAGQEVSSLVRVNDEPGVHLILPIAKPDGKVESWVTAVFLLSDEAAGGLLTEPLQAVGWVLLIVLVISGLLYPVILRLAGRLASFSSDLLEANLEMMEALGCAIAKRDGDTDAHNYRVTLYSVRLAEKEGLSTQAIQGLIKGAFLHDIGKIGIRDEVLLKPGRLTEDEFSVMRTHVDHGLDIVGRARWLHDALAIVGSHHEKYDGQGYPGKVPGDMIPAAARIFAITDVFDALNSKRPYKKAMSLEQVIGILEEGRGSHFDPGLLSSFLTLAPGLHQEMNNLDTEELRQRMHQINRQYFTANLETLLA